VSNAADGEQGTLAEAATACRIAQATLAFGALEEHFGTRAQTGRKLLRCRVRSLARETAPSNKKAAAAAFFNSF
jgi:hypothetical protein